MLTKTRPEFCLKKQEMKTMYRASNSTYERKTVIYRSNLTVPYFFFTLYFCNYVRAKSAALVRLFTPKKNK